MSPFFFLFLYGFDLFFSLDLGLDRLGWVGLDWVEWVWSRWHYKGVFRLFFPSSFSSFSFFFFLLLSLLLFFIIAFVYA